MLEILKTVSGIVWGPPLIILLLGTGLYLTFRLRFVQFRGMPHAFRLAFGSDKKYSGEGDINHFQALMTALSATVGTGNIVGVATAISLGGPGALFWMWITGLLGMATKYTEAVLAVRFRERDDRGEMAGGPMYYLWKGLNAKWAGFLYAAFTAGAAFGIGNMVQANAIKDATIRLASGGGLTLYPALIGGVLAILTGMVILGGIRGIGKVTGYLVPFMIVLYMSAGLIAMVLNFGAIPAALAEIFTRAFSAEAGTGGAAGIAVMTAMRYGVARGIFSNESGMGSAAIAAAAAKTRDPVSQALVSMTQTFIDTIIVCTLTGLTIVIAGDWSDPELTGLNLTASAFGNAFSGGQWIPVFAIIPFAFSTVIGWYYYGERSIQFLAGSRAILPYKFLWVGAAFLGTVQSLEFVWTFSDIMNGLMVLPNVIALLALSALVARESRDYFKDIGS